jgi:hypothetical protein
MHMTYFTVDLKGHSEYDLAKDFGNSLSKECKLKFIDI